MRLIGFVLFLLVGISHAQSNVKEPTIEWNADRPLQWHNFKARPYSNSTAVALTASGISFGYSLKTMDGRIIDFTADVEANFYPNKSWYIRNRASDYILKHEQLHFDITELYTRIFRQRLSQLKVNQNIRQQLDKLNQTINEEVNATQKRYDLETNHSINTEAQRSWERFIADELRKLESFSSK